MLSFQKYFKGNFYQRRSSAKMTATNQVSFSLWDGEEVHYCHQLKSYSPLGVYMLQPMAKTGKDSK